MNISAYFTTGFAIKALANLSKADVVIHGEDNIPTGPTIFVINHFTRLETLLIPAYIYSLTQKPAFSLASDTLFKGGLAKLLDLVGVISTKNPNRDKIIISSLLTGSENWIIFPEGRMVKTKKIIGDGKFLISHAHGRHEPHTGAASLALRAEFFRHCLLRWENDESENVHAFLQSYEIDSFDDIRDKVTSIVPVNLTYYPIRAKDNMASQFATRVMKEVPERMLEELMTEGTMLFSGVDLDIHIGTPITVDDFLESDIVQQALSEPFGSEPKISGKLDRYMRNKASDLMQVYMKAIYDMTTVNHEHLFASFLELYPYSRINETGLRRRVYLAAKMISESKMLGCNLHKSLKENQIHLLTDDRYKKVENFLELAVEKNLLEKRKKKLIKISTNLKDFLQFHRGRIDNPIRVMVNEVEPLTKVRNLIRSIAWQPNFLVKYRVVKSLLEEEKNTYRNECKDCRDDEIEDGDSFILHGSTKKIGVVLIHSYLSVPREVRELATYLNRQGLWIYAPRLAGHGTSPEDLATTDYSAWQHSVERGYAIMSSICSKVVLGGVSIGGCLALDLASRLKTLAGVFAVCPPLRLKDYSSSFMPGIDVWQRILAKLKRDDLDVDYFLFDSENPYVNYDKNPVLGVKNVGQFLEALGESLAKVKHPSLILHADRDPVVDSSGSRIIYEELGTEEKEYVLMNYDNHIITSGEDSKRVHKLIGSFIREVSGR